MTVSRAFLDRCAVESGYDAGSLEKVIRLGEMASDLNAHSLLRSALLLKGGTPLNLAFGAPTRLSVDLDYNYVGAVDRDAMLAERPQVETAIVEIAQRAGYRVQQSANEFAGRKFFLGYQSALGGTDRIEVDVSYLLRIPLEEPCELSLWQPGGLDPPSVRVVSPTELVVGKVLAFLDRAAPRDAWDIAMLPDTLATELQSSRFRSWLIAMSAILDHPVTTYTAARMKGLLTPDVIEERLIPMLTANQAVDAATLGQDAWSRISPIIELTEDERAYVESVSIGEARTSLLFPDDEIRAERASSHPAIRWKLRNVRSQITRES